MSPWAKGNCTGHLSPLQDVLLTKQSIQRHNFQIKQQLIYIFDSLFQLTMKQSTMLYKLEPEIELFAFVDDEIFCAHVNLGKKAPCEMSL